MLIFNHETRFGNSFNLAFVQHLLFEEYKISSVHPHGEKFRNLFNGLREKEFGYFGEGCVNEELEVVTIGVERFLLQAILYEQMSILNFRDCMSFLDTQKNDKIIYSRGEFIDYYSAISPTKFDVNNLNPNKVSVLNGGHYFGFDDISRLRIKHQEEFRKLFQLTDQARSAIKQDKLKPKSEGVYTVGVHIRRTDYQNFLGGKFYFSDADYLQVCRHILQMLGVGNVSFLFFSDEKLDPQAFAGIDFDFNQGNMHEDFFTMAHCDAVLGPPSSFSNAASFINKATRLVVRNVDEFISLHDTPSSIRDKKWFPHCA